MVGANVEKEKGLLASLIKCINTDIPVFCEDISIRDDVNRGERAARLIHEHASVQPIAAHDHRSLPSVPVAQRGYFLGLLFTLARISCFCCIPTDTLCLCPL